MGHEDRRKACLVGLTVLSLCCPQEDTQVVTALPTSLDLEWGEESPVLANHSSVIKKVFVLVYP